MFDCNNLTKLRTLLATCLSNEVLPHFLMSLFSLRLSLEFCFLISYFVVAFMLTDKVQTVMV